MKKGARIRVLATGELGTVAEKQLIRKGGETKIYLRVVINVLTNLKRFHRPVSSSLSI